MLPPDYSKIVNDNINFSKCVYSIIYLWKKICGHVQSNLSVYQYVNLKMLS